MDRCSSPELVILRNFYALRIPDIYPADCGHLQAVLIEHILESPLFANFPPSQTFQMRFWKEIIGHLESAQDVEEVDSRLYDCLLSLMSKNIGSDSHSHVRGPPSPSFITYIWRHPSTRALVSTTLLEARTTIEAGTTGLRTWGASLAFSQYLQHHQDLVRQKRVLELGCGAGLLGIVISQLEAKNVVLTDYHPIVLDGCLENIDRALNVAQGSVQVATLDWFESLSEDTRPALEQNVRGWDVDVVVGADIVYSPDIIPALAQCIHLILSASRKDVAALVALTLRREDTFAQFVSALQVVGLVVHVQQLSFDRDGDFMSSASLTDVKGVYKLVNITKDFANARFK